MSYPLAASDGESDSDSDDSDDNSSPPFSADGCADEQYTWQQLREMMGDIAVVDGYGMLGAALGVRDCVTLAWTLCQSTCVGGLDVRCP